MRKQSPKQHRPWMRPIGALSTKPPIKPTFFTLISNPRQGRKGTPNRRVCFQAKTLLPSGREYYLHTTKGWRSRPSTI